MLDPGFHFLIEFDGNRIGFTEVSGLTQEVQAIDYREGGTPDDSTSKIPGMQKYSNITCKRGFASDNEFFDWIRAVRLSNVERRIKGDGEIYHNRCFICYSGFIIIVRNVLNDYRI